MARREILKLLGPVVAAGPRPPRLSNPVGVWLHQEPISAASHLPSTRAASSWARPGVGKLHRRLCLKLPGAGDVQACAAWIP